MSTLTITLDDHAARLVEDAARAESKPIEDWLAEHVRLEAARSVAFSRLEADARAHGYPPGWSALFGSLAVDATFAAPPRGPSRPVSAHE